MKARHVAVWFALLSLAACERGMHNMYDQPYYRPGAPSQLFADGNASRRPPWGTVAAASGSAAATSSGRRTETAAAYQLTDAGSYLALLQRGRQRYDIYCAACHGLSGAGDGMVVQRGFPAPLPFTDPSIMQASDAGLAQAIQRGYGVMYPFADRVNQGDGQAIVAYIRALQLSQHVTVSQLQPRDVVALHAAGVPAQHGGGRE
ncbi:c-type cytochrome [Dyella acidiphila]|uniref:Cytochrome c n=1 Tax=Dyella acidiphila TaxID=2775866 RepID=A0ABR9GBX8_9GAMM|nr:cytochrome c [Dyella acidiphila]MBE1161536.1 cytochrome c [Dyella acidiphila]